MAQIIYLTSNAIIKLLELNGYTFIDEPNKLVFLVTKDGEHIVTVHYETVRTHLMLTSNTYKLYLKRTLNDKSKTYFDDVKILDKLLYSAGIRLAIKNNSTLRTIINKAQNQLFKQSN